jgi:hypothetical protein
MAATSREPPPAASDALRVDHIVEIASQSQLKAVIRVQAAFGVRLAQERGSLPDASVKV